MNEPGIAERIARVARQIVVTKLQLRTPAVHLTSGPFALRPDVEDFQKPFEVYLRKEMLVVARDEARRGNHFDRVAELETEMIEADKAILRLVL